VGRTPRAEALCSCGLWSWFLHETLGPQPCLDMELGPFGVLCTRTRRALINRQTSARSLSRSPSPPPPSFTQSPFPPRSLVRDGQTSPHRPRLVVSRSTCPPLSPSPHANSFIIGTAVQNTHTVNEYHRREPRTNIWPAGRMRGSNAGAMQVGHIAGGLGLGFFGAGHQTSLRKMSSWGRSALYYVGALLVTSEGSEV
jgi:hypothetical protein